MANVNFNRELSFSNLSKEEWSAVRNLRSRNDIVTKPADKGGAFVVWRTDLYREEAYCLLFDCTFYHKVNKDLTTHHQKIVKITLEMRSSFIKRHYPAAIVDLTTHKAFSIDRTRITALTLRTRAASDRIPFTITFHPVNNSIKPTVNRNFDLLNLDSSPSSIFSHRPLFSFKKDRNPRTFLVKGTLPSNKELGTFVVPVNDV